MADPIFINPQDLVGSTLPPEILSQLEILGRVKFTPKPTTASAVSTAGDVPDKDTEDIDAKVSGLLNHVDEMENLAKQIEDMIDDLTKDMSIPVENDTLANAVKSLDPNGNGNITKDVFDKAVAIINHAPIMIYGYDPVLTALTGNGKVEGDFLNCDQVTKSVSDLWNTADPKSYTPEQPIIDETSKIADDYEKSLGRMLIEMLQMFFFNMIWAKYLVDLAIINPTRLLVAMPLDSIICFFKSMTKQCGNNAKRFKIKSKECLEQNGPVNKLVNKIRCALLCIPPAKLWDLKKYKPMVENFNCDCQKYLNPCPPESTLDGGDESKSNLGGLENIMNSIFPDNEPCFPASGLIGQADTTKPDGLGISPECLNNAKIIIEAVIADALSPSDPTKTGLAAATSSASDIVTGQIAGIGS